MFKRLGRGSRFLAALAAASAGFALTAGAHNEGLTIFTHSSGVEPGTQVGVGGDGSLVLYSSYFSFIPPESLITADDLVNKPYLSNNMDLFSWTPTLDLVTQFSATSNIEDDQSSGYLYYTTNDQVVLTSTTADGRDRIGSRTAAVAFRSNADQGKPGPAVSITEVDSRIASLGGGHTIFVWDTERRQFNTVFDTLLTQPGVDVGHPAIAMRTQQGPASDAGFATRSIREVFVAFDGNANPAQDNADGNSEIFLWSRRHFLAPVPPSVSGVVFNGGVTQVTHTVNGDCWAPSVNRRGDVAFLSDADITGENGDGSVELFVWSRGRFTQVTDIDFASLTIAGIGGSEVDEPYWAVGRRVLYFTSTADLTGSNPEGNREIFRWNGHRIRQVTRTTTGTNFCISVADGGQKIAFLSDADLPGLTPGSGVPEVVVTNGQGRNLVQVTETEDGGTNERPIVTAGGGGAIVTFVSDSNLDGRNSNRIPRLYRARARRHAEPGLPAGN